MPNALVVAFDSRVTVQVAPRCRRASAGSACRPHRHPALSGVDNETPGWVVDGQQRAAALTRCRLNNFPVPVVAFITDDLREQRAQFILVNNTKPLPKGLSTSLLPATDGAFAGALLRKRYPRKLLSLLNLLPDSPMAGGYQDADRCQTGGSATTRCLKMIENSITDGALYRYRDPLQVMVTPILWCRCFGTSGLRLPPPGPTPGSYRRENLA